ncbi:MAG: hypothetical protein J7K23_02010 [Thermoproteales archaeon]|nr:hypothetical protein [Thermoproteales archaeon]
MEVKAPKTIMVLKKCNKPRRYTELLRETKLSDRGLRIALKKLLSLEFLDKTDDGRYVLTEKGREILKEIEAVELLQGVYRAGLDDIVRRVQQVNALALLFFYGSLTVAMGKGVYSLYQKNKKLREIVDRVLVEDIYANSININKKLEMLDKVIEKRDPFLAKEISLTFIKNAKKEHEEPQGVNTRLLRIETYIGAIHGEYFSDPVLEKLVEELKSLILETIEKIELYYKQIKT